MYNRTKCLTSCNKIVGIYRISGLSNKTSHKKADTKHLPMLILNSTAYEKYPQKSPEELFPFTLPFYYQKQIINYLILVILGLENSVSSISCIIWFFSLDFFTKNRIKMKGESITEFKRVVFTE